MTILALDSVFEQCSVALLSDDGAVITVNTLPGSRQQTQQILPMIHAMLTEQSCSLGQLTAIAFNRGPGAFSGIRINTAVAHALAFAHDLPCLPVSSLQALAQKALTQNALARNAWAQNALPLSQLWASGDRCYTAIDARMNQIYVGEFVAQAITDTALQTNIPLLMLANQAEQLMDYGTNTAQDYPIFGDGAAFLAKKDNQTIFAYDECSRPDASVIGQIGAVMLAQGKAVTAENALPVYLRHNAWKTLAEQRA